MDKKLLTISSLLILVFLIFAGYMLFNKPIGNFTRAANLGGTASISNSLVFAWPLNLPADGTSQSSITVFIRDAESRGVSQKQVLMRTNIGTIDQPEQITDSDGKVIYTLTSTTPGVANLEFYVDNRKLEKSVTVQFK